MALSCWWRPHQCLLFLLLLSLSATNAITLLTSPPPVSASDTATFSFDSAPCFFPACSLLCKLDNYSASDCESREISYSGLRDGDHTFTVCINMSTGAQCDSYNWIVDTIPPTAAISASSPFTSLTNVSINILFNEPCSGGGGFRCSSDYCSLLVYGAGHVLPSTLKVLRPDLEFSVVVALSSDIQYGRLVLAMDKNFCSDAAGNRFTRSINSTFFLHVDRRNVFVDVKTHVMQKLIQLNGETRTVQATNNHKNLRIYLYFSEPVINSSTQILNVLKTSRGSLSPINGDTLGNRRFGYTVSDIANMSIITVACETNFISTRQGTPVSPSEPYTFLYDAERPSVSLSTTSDLRARGHKIPVLVKFIKPVFDFNSSAILISGGHLSGFHEISKSIYSVEIHADDSSVSVEVPENATEDVAGNRNLASNKLQVWHYSVPTVSSLVSTITTVVFGATSMTAALLTVSTASLLSSGVFSKPAAHLKSEPSRNLFRIAYHIQVFALSKWLAVSLPIDYYEFSRGIEWSIPYLPLPWETEGLESFTKDTSPVVVTYSRVPSDIPTFKPVIPLAYPANSSTYAPPLTAMEYTSFLPGQSMMPEAEFIKHSQNLDRWKYLGRNMFWLATIGGGLMILHIVLLITLRLKRKNSEDQKDFGALLFPKFEIFLLLLALPCICQASAAIIPGKTLACIAVGAVLAFSAAILLIALLVFLSIGITAGKLLQYKEVHQENSHQPRCYSELLRITLGPGKRGQWSSTRPDSPNPTRFGPLFEDLRGPPKYMLTQFSTGPPARDRIIDTDDENEDAEAPFIQKLFGILRIYYTALEAAKRACLGLLAGAFSSHEGTTRGPAVVAVSLTAFQLFFMLLKKPFIKKRVQLVEIISVFCELVVFASSLFLVERDVSVSGEKNVGFLMLAVFGLSMVAQFANEWYALYLQVKNMGGVGNAVRGILVILLPARLVKEAVGPASGGPAGERPWLRQLRELAKESFSKEEDPANVASTSAKSGGFFWKGKRSGSSSMTSSTDFKAKGGDAKEKSRGLYKDLEAIFSSN